MGAPRKELTKIFVRLSRHYGGGEREREREGERGRERSIGLQSLYMGVLSLCSVYTYFLLPVAGYYPVIISCYVESRGDKYKRSIGMYVSV